MATGITSKNKRTKEKISVYLGYEGKKDKNDILELPFLNFDYVTSINGKSKDNKFFSEIILKSFCTFYIQGIKER